MTVPTTQELIESRNANSWVPLDALAMHLENLTSRHSARKVTPSDVLAELRQLAIDAGDVEMARVIGQAIARVFEQELSVLNRPPRSQEIAR